MGYHVFPTDLSHGFVAQIVDVLWLSALYLTALSGKNAKKIREHHK